MGSAELNLFELRFLNPIVETKSDATLTVEIKNYLPANIEIELIFYPSISWLINISTNNLFLSNSLIKPEKT